MNPEPPNTVATSVIADRSCALARTTGAGGFCHCPVAGAKGRFPEAPKSHVSDRWLNITAASFPGPTLDRSIRAYLCDLGLLFASVDIARAAPVRVRPKKQCSRG